MSVPNFVILGPSILELIKPVVEALLCHQLRMGANLPDPSLVEDNDSIGMLDG